VQRNEKVLSAAAPPVIRLIAGWRPKLIHPKHRILEVKRRHSRVRPRVGRPLKTGRLDRLDSTNKGGLEIDVI
jgi:hypothetical protein